ncbi:hypothetical protein [Pyxidicoccus xibeiensis]|uniref:hypothetical protein n=1 Tax=Pyxidicoccus xibeiensis TaxID=2906759 RepID=UPI0020A77035|nr:hypothetical protein [Pyxidicoccus xibeiensis]MCP3138999.1 hypothetical protein [Pyxidicoccus xibeiensis]
MMRRFLLCMAVAQILGIGTLLAPTDTWAQGRGRSARSAKSKSSKKSTSKAPPKIETKSPAVTDPVTGEPEAAATAAPPQRGPARIDFDDRLIQGQTNKSGAVYLYDRKELKTRSMIRERDSFRSETLATVYDQ